MAKEPVVVVGFYTFFLTCEYKFILLRYGECKAMQAGACSLWKRAKTAWHGKIWCLFWCLLELEF